MNRILGALLLVAAMVTTAAGTGMDRVEFTTHPSNLVETA